MRGFLSGFPTSGNKKKNAAKQDMLNQIRKGGVVKETNDEKFKKMVKQKMDDMMEKAMMGGAPKYGMPKNGQPEKKMSKTMEKFYEQMKMKKKQKEAKIEAQKVVVKKKSFSGGGYMTEDGKVCDASGKVVATINLKNGDIMNSLGMKVGKYKEGFMTNNKLSGMVQSSAPKKAFNPFATASSTTTQAQGPLNIWSTFETKDDNNSSWW